jgi:hypothetical protein
MISSRIFFFLKETNKILFYYPKEIPEDTQIKDVGLSEAIIQFTG